MRAYVAGSLCLLLLIFPGRVAASDHADPAWLSNGKQEANLTGLFFFPKGDRYVIILNTRPTLTAPPPYNLRPYVYSINIDMHSRLRFKASEDFQCGVTPPDRGDADAQLLNGNFCRYGGTVMEPTGIAPDVTLSFALENNTSLLRDKLKISGAGIDRDVPVQIFNNLLLGVQARDPSAIWVYTGVRDDPFIFPKFFNSNVITMIVSIPKSAFLSKNPDWLLWGTSRYEDGGKQIDHVGRSNRTQLGRFDILNTEAPSRHVAVLRKATDGRIGVQNFLKEVARPLSNLNQLSGFVLRGYDYAPDVMVFSTRFPPGFPNGRRLEDDVAETTCQWGDCPLHENSYSDAKTFPRVTTNDKALLNDFPYLAQRWPWRPQPFVGSPWHWFSNHLLWPLVLLLVALYLLRRGWRAACAGLRLANARRADPMSPTAPAAIGPLD